MNPNPSASHVLFICTGNYYRSRVAEILFNHQATLNGINARAFSRGFRLNPEKNTEVISPHATSFLSKLNIHGYNVGTSRQLGLDDLQNARHIIVMDEKEHRPMMKERFPQWENKVEYWHLQDDYLEDPHIVLPELQRRVEALAESFNIRLKHSTTE